MIRMIVDTAVTFSLLASLFSSDSIPLYMHVVAPSTYYIGVSACRCITNGQIKQMCPNSSFKEDILFAWNWRVSSAHPKIGLNF